MSLSKKPAVFSFILVTIILLVVGFLALISASSGTGARLFGDPLYYVKQQYLIGLAAAGFVFFVFYKIPYQFWRKTSVLWLGVSLILVLLAFIPQFELPGETAHRWFKLGPLSLQPSELLRFFYIIFLAAWLAKTSTIELKSFSRGIIPFAIILGI
ncbi:MAG TPA: FtsW/RodA/SpoVE family cell cycle protein, partial [Candidatus Paceibacterota bacterium]|nr:FtsW/RodA/SpoVE family cell cycle protein [Candidatus Paceibacterota bacterium]